MDDPKVTLARLKPATVTGRLRELRPLIEQKIAAGVRIAEIVNALTAAGLAVSESTLKSFLYRERKKGARTGQPSHRSLSSEGATSVSYDTEAPKVAALPTETDRRPPLSPQELHDLMHPDPAKQAADIARYERLGNEIARAQRKGQTSHKT
jgi:hypothetical protein